MSTRVPGPGGPGHALRTFTADRSVTQHRLRPGTLRRVAALARPHRRDMSVFLMVVAVSAALTALTPLLIRRLLDEGVTAGRRDVVLGSATLLALAAVGAAALAVLSRRLSARIGERLVMDLRTRVFDHVQSMPVSFFTRSRTGTLVQRLSGDVLGAQQAFTQTLSTVVSNVLTVVLVLLAMASMSWQLTVGAVLLVPLFVLPARRVGQRLAGLTAQTYTLNAEMTQTMTERFSVAGALHVTLMADPAEESRAFADRAASVRDVGIERARWASLLRISLTLLASVAVAAVYGFGGLMALSGTLTVGVLVALAAYLTQLYGPITALSNVQVDVMGALVSFERVFEVLDLVPAITDGPGARPLPRPAGAVPPAVELDHVGFTYPSGEGQTLDAADPPEEGDGARPTLDDVTLRLAPGEKVALVGASGAGKTTLWQLIARLYDVDAGSVRIAGQDVRSTTRASLRETVGVVTQDAHLFHDTVRANLLLSRPGATEAELIEALDRAQVLDVVRRLPRGLDTVVGDRGYRLSGGERQRLAIARLLLTDPGVVILDEATAHLDATSERAVLRALDEAVHGRTSLVIAHRLSTVRSADRVVVLDRGRVVQEGTHADLLAIEGPYATLYTAQLASAAA